MRKVIGGIVLALLLGGATIVYAKTVYCPIHEKSSCYFTGKTKSVDGIFMKQYKCPWNHKFWIRADRT